MAGTMIIEAVGKAGTHEANEFIVITSDTDQCWCVASEETGVCGSVPKAALRKDEISAIELVEDDGTWSIRIILATGRTYTYDCDTKESAEALTLEAINLLSA